MTENNKNSIATAPTIFIDQTSHVNLNIKYTSEIAITIAQLDRNSFMSAGASSLRNLTATIASIKATTPPIMYQNIC